MSISPESLGNAEIEELDTVAVSKNVAGFKVAVDDADIVCGLHGFADANEELKALLERKALFGAENRDQGAIDEFHREVGARFEGMVRTGSGR